MSATGAISPWNFSRRTPLRHHTARRRPIWQRRTGRARGGGTRRGFPADFPLLSYLGPLPGNHCGRGFPADFPLLS